MVQPTTVYRLGVDVHCAEKESAYGYKSINGNPKLSLKYRRQVGSIVTTDHSTFHDPGLLLKVLETYLILIIKHTRVHQYSFVFHIPFQPE